MFEGAFMHSRGVYRSEPNSCMNNDIPYYNTISRESIVRRIKSYAGETFLFDDFVRNDCRDVTVTTRSAVSPWISNNIHHSQYEPVIIKGSPVSRKGMTNRKRKKL